MSTLAEIERAVEALPPEQWAEFRRWMDRKAYQHRDTAQARTIPLIAPTGRPITQQQIDDALDAD